MTRSKSVVLFFVIAFFLQCAANEYICRYLSINDGMSASCINTMTRDSRGLMWFGTRFGLNRYDFNDVTNYFHNTADSSSIPGNNVRLLFTDQRDTIWVACEEGTARYDASADNFRELFYWKKNEKRKLNIRSYCNEDGGMLLGGPGCLFRYTFADDSLRVLNTKGGTNKFYTGILPRGNNEYVLITRWDGVWLFNSADNSISDYPGITDRGIMAATLNSKGMLWVSPYGKGLQLYNRDGRCIKNINKSNSLLPNDIVLDVMFMDGKLWIATDGGGISIYNPDTDSFETVGMASPKAVTTLYRDRHNNMYAGTVRDGAMHISRTAMKTYRSNPAQGTTIAAAISVFCDKDGTLWVGDDGNGLLMMGSDRKLTNIASTAGMKVVSIVPYDEKHLLLSVFGHGFMLFNKQTLQLSGAPDILNRITAEYSPKALAIHTCDLGGGNIALLSNQIRIFNQSSNNVSEPLGRADGPISPFFHNKSILLCFNPKFICEYNLSNDRYRKLVTADDNEPIVAVCFDGIDKIYYTNGSTLNSFDIKTNTNTKVEIGNIHRISTLAIDGDDIWLGSNKAVHKLNISSGKIMEFGESDGVAANEYLPNATLVCPDAIYMGGVNGLLRIDRNSLQNLVHDHNALSLSIADLLVDGKSVYGQISNGSIEIPPGSNSLRLKLIADGSNYIQRQSILFHISGGDIDRYIESSDHMLDLSMLKEGHRYKIYASTTTSNGSWSQEQAVLDIRIPAPWYKSEWIALAIILAFMAILMLVFIMLAKRNRRKYELRAIENHNRAISEQRAFLKNTSRALERPLNEISNIAGKLRTEARNNDNFPLMSQLKLICADSSEIGSILSMAAELHGNKVDKDSLNIIDCELQPLLDSAVDSMQKKADDLKIGMLVDAPHEPIIVECDPEKLEYIISIFIDNALKRSAENSMIRVAAVLTDESKKVRVEVIDNGLTLDKEQTANLFSMNSYDSTGNNSSLALSYSKVLAEAQNARCGAEKSSYRNGLSVWIELNVFSHSQPESN